MFSDDYMLASVRAQNAAAVLKCSSPELDMDDGFGGRETPEGIPPVDIPLVKCVKWNVPTGAAAADGESEGLRPIRRAVAHEIPPDAETRRLKKSISPEKRRHSRKPSFEIESGIDRGTVQTPDSELDDRTKWPPSSRCSPMSMESSSERPEYESIAALSEIYRHATHPYAASDDASSFDQDNIRMSYDAPSMHRSSGERTCRKSGSHGRGCRRIPDVAAAVHTHSARTSTDRTALKLLRGGGLNGYAGNYDNPIGHRGERGFIVSPLPSERQMRDLKSARRSFDTDSESGDTVSAQSSGYSGPLEGYTAGDFDAWARMAREHPCASSCQELHPRFNWLKRSVAPFTALAGAFLVFYGPRVLKYRRKQI